MAPHREESLDEVFIVEEQSAMNASSPSSAVEDNELLQVDDDNDLAIKTQSMIPKSILRPSRYTNSQDNTDNNGGEDGTSMPAHWPSTPRFIEDQSTTTSTGSGVNSLLSSLLGNNNYNNNQQRTTVVQFLSPLVTSTNTRPRTHILDIPSLYYSASDIKHFKREYRQLVHVQNVTRRSMELNSLDTVAAANNKNGSGSGSGGIRLKSGGRLQPHDNTFWRSKVGRRGGRFTSSSSSSTSSSQPPFVSSSVQEAPPVAVDKQQQKQKQEPVVVDHDDDSFWDPLNDGTTPISSSPSYCDSSHNNNNDDERREQHQDQGMESSSSYSSGGSSSSSGGGFFSSVFDVAREAVTILNGPSYSHSHSSGTSYSSNSPSRTTGSVNKRRQQCNTSLHLVDTLYLF